MDIKPIGQDRGFIILSNGTFYFLELPCGKIVRTNGKINLFLDLQSISRFIDELNDELLNNEVRNYE